MKKTTTISIAKTLFHIEEDAYAILDAYLTSVRTHFSTHPDREEILSDIESRIAERFSENGTPIVTVPAVEFVIDAMGSIEELDEESMAEGVTSKTRKRLYRDPDTRVLAGVASGLGYYLGIDRTLIRVLFLVSIFFGGFGVFVYIILWIATPLATTAAQKLEMHGVPVTLKAMSEVVRERLEEIDEKHLTDGAKKLGSAIERSAREIGTWLWPVLRAAAGVFLTAGGVLGAALLTIFAGIALFGVPEHFFGASGAAVLSGPLYYFALLGLYGALVLPVVIVALWGIGILRKKSLFTRVNAMVFASVWFIAIVMTGVLVSRLVYRVHEQMKNDPLIQAQSVVLPLEAFTSLEVRERARVSVVIGDEYKVELSGSKNRIERTSASVTNGVLSITGGDIGSSCVFCPTERLSITVTVPTLSALSVFDESTVEGEVNASALSVSLSDHGSAVIEGSATTIEVDARNEVLFDGARFSVKSARIMATDNAHVVVNADTILVVDAYDSAAVFYHSSPEVSIKKSDAAEVVPSEEE